MPELPEVEIVCRQLQKKIESADAIIKIEFLSPKLRTILQLPPALKFPLKQVQLFRRSKFIIFKFLHHHLWGYFISHLGMTGSWRVITSNKNLSQESKRHDHVRVYWRSGAIWIYNDPRRFGLFEYVDRLEDSKWLASLGAEPLDKNLNREDIVKKIKSSKRVIKDTIMDSKIVVGVGNIYACEALFAAKLNPFLLSGNISKQKLNHLLNCIESILKHAIAKGGSSIKSYTQANGRRGSFQKEHLVYGREGEKCKTCSTNIQRKMFHGRSVFWCPVCQK